MPAFMFYLELYKTSGSLVVCVGTGTYCSLFSEGIAGGMVEYRARLPLLIFNLVPIEDVDCEFFFSKDSCPELPTVGSTELELRLMKWVG